MFSVTKKNKSAIPDPGSRTLISGCVCPVDGSFPIGHGVSMSATTS